MKKMVLLMALLLVVSLTANAQNEVNVQGENAKKWWVGGAVGLTVKTSSDLNQKAISGKLLPEFGKNFSKNWALGFSLGYAHEEDFELSGSNSKPIKAIVDEVQAAIFVRFSFLQGSFGKAFIDGGLQFGSGRLYANNSYSSSATTFVSVAIGFTPGVSVNLTDAIQLIGKFGFLGIQYAKVKETSAISYGFDFDLSQFQLGVNVKF